MRVRFAVVAAALVLPALAACGGGTTSALSPVPSPATSRQLQVSGTFAAAPGGTAVTYDPTLVPAGASATVTADESPTGTGVTLQVSGLQPNRKYGAHVHVKPCGAAGKDAGAHFQYQPDPVSPSVDPAYANPKNEIWLDITTDAGGAGTAKSTVSWVFPADRRAGSVIVHAMPTATEAGKAGTAGDRAACVSVPF